MDRFRGHQTEHERMHELLQREQQPGESADDYIHAMQQLASRLKKPMPERQLVKVVKKGLRDGIARYVYAMDVLTVDELREECVEVKRSFGRRGRAAYLQQSKLRVSEAHVQDEVDEQRNLEMDELLGRVRNPFRPGFWNRGAAEHGFQDCEATEWRRFCFRCGKLGVISPKCPDCTENGRLGSPKAGVTRPGWNPAK